MITLGAKLKDLRLRRGASLQTVANAVCTSKAHLHSLEKGKTSNPSINLLLNFAAYYNTSVAFLIGEEQTEDDNVAMLREFRKLSDRDKKIVHSLVLSMSSQH